MSLLSDLSLVWILSPLILLLLLLPSSLRGAVKMTALHHLLFELLLWELPGWFLIHAIATEKQSVAGRCHVQVLSVHNEA